jgi:hypothetical protein
VDPYQELQAKAREIAQMLSNGQKPPTTYTGDDGTVIQGWCIESSSQPDAGDRRFSNAIGDWEEVWGTRELILTTDGKLYEYDDHSHEYGAGRSGGERIDRSKRLKERTPSLLVGSRGKPFSEIKGKLERLPWTI